MTKRPATLRRAGVVLSRALRARNPQLHTARPEYGMQDTWPTGREPEFQAAAERLCESRGYVRRSPAGLAGVEAAVGVFGHVRQAQGNPVFGDLPVVHRSGRYAEIELKTGAGRLNPEQRALSEFPWFRVCRSLAEVLDELER